jgi:predicted XRE-type DNA-binding protein
VRAAQFSRVQSDPIPELKRRAAARIVRQLREHSGFDAAIALEISTRRVWDIRAGRLDRFSLEMLIKFMTRLRMRVEIRIDGEVM